MTISATLKGPKDNTGRRKIYIRINDGKVRKFHATQMKIEPANWKGKVIGPLAKDYNAKIKSLIIQYETGGMSSIPVRFTDYVTKCLNEWDRIKKYETIRQITSEMNKFKRFSNPLLSSISPQMLYRYKEYCYGLGNKGNSVWKSFKFLRLVLRKVHREKVINSNPFDLFEMPKYRDPKKIYLSKDQVEKINLKCQEVKELSLAGTWFVIACYTGLRFGDLVAFNKSKIKNGRLIVYTAKTGEVVSMPLNEKLKGLFERVDYKPLPYTNTHYNRLLKAVGAYCEIDEVLTSHVARHTCATMLASAGVSIEVTAKILGHESIKSTAIYYKITGDRIDKEFAKLF